MIRNRAANQVLMTTREACENAASLLGRVPRVGRVAADSRDYAGGNASGRVLV